MTYSAAELIQIIASLTTFAGVVGGILISLRNGARTSAAISEIQTANLKTDLLHQEVKDNTAVTHKIAVATDGMQTQLTAATMVAGIAEGVKREKASEANREEGRAEIRAENGDKS